jgi:hypothetical protein
MSTPASKRRVEQPVPGWVWVLLGFLAYCMLAFFGGLLLLTYYFDQTHPAPLSTPAFLAVVFVAGPLALLAYGALEVFVVLLLRAIAAASKWVWRTLVGPKA